MAHYLLLISLTKNNTKSGLRVRENVQRDIDPEAYPLWFDAAHVGIVMTTERYAADLWKLALKGAEDLRDILILQLGRDWCAVRETKNAGWLNAHAGPPLWPGQPR